MPDRIDNDQPEPEGGLDRPIVIPDGGLGSALPAWMQETPAWKDTTAVVATVVARTLPEPETTPIELADILTLADLPSWLQAIADRQAQEAGTTEEPEATPAHQLEPVPAAPSASAPETGMMLSSTDPPRVVPTTPQPWWASDAAMGALMIAVVLVAIFVLLRATNVI